MVCFKININFEQKGFTFLELLIIVGIIIILVGITIPAFKDFKPDLQLSGVVRELATDIRYAQQLTVTEQIEYCIRFFQLEKKYQIIKCGQEQPLVEKIFPQEIQMFTITDFINNEIEFNPYGAVKESGSISLENTKNKIKTIEVRPSGFVRIIN